MFELRIMIQNRLLKKSKWLVWTPATEDKMKSFFKKLIGLISLSIVLNFPIVAQSNVVTINSSGNLVVNGTPFFMNAIYNNVECYDYTTTADLTTIKAAGINTVMTYNQLRLYDYAYLTSYLNRAKAAGLMVIIDVTVYTKSGELSLIQSAVNQFKNHPALLGWYAFDEFWDTTKTRQAYSAIKALDKNHLVWGVLCCFDTDFYKGFQKSADIIGFDLYAVGRGPQETKQAWMYEWSTWMAAEYTPPSNTIMSVSQIFNQKSYSENYTEAREPTLQEKRLAAYLLLVGGNKGNFFYSYFDLLGKSRDCVAWPTSVVSNNLAEMKIYGQEIDDVGRMAILNGTQFNRKEQGDTALLKTIGYKESSTEVYVLAANISMGLSRTVTVDIPITTWTNADVRVLYGNITALKVGSRLQITTPAGESGTIRIGKNIVIPNAICATTQRPVIDGTAENTWADVQAINIVNSQMINGLTSTSSDLSANYKITWDSTALYLLVNVIDDTLKNDSGTSTWDDDGIELFVDGNNEKGSTYDANDHQYIFRVNDATVHEYGIAQTVNPAGVAFVQGNYEGGYLMEIKINWSAIGVTAANAKLAGLDVQVNDDDNGGTKDARMMWFSQSGQSPFVDPSLFGTIKLNNTSCGITTGLLDNTTSNLFNVYPNPADQLAVIRYLLLENSTVEILICDVLTKEVMQVVNEKQTTGEHILNIGTTFLQNGIYFVKMSVDGKQIIQKLIISK